MPKVYYYKELNSVPYFVAGAPVQFEPLPGNRGVLSLDSPQHETLITALNSAAEKHIGGIVRISEAQYTEKKTLAASTPSLPRRAKEMLRPMPKAPFQRKQDMAAAAEPAKPVPAPTPQTVTAPPPGENVTGPPVVEGFRPATRKISRKRAGDVMADALPK